MRGLPARRLLLGDPLGATQSRWRLLVGEGLAAHAQHALAWARGAPQPLAQGGRRPSAPLAAAAARTSVNPPTAQASREFSSSPSVEGTIGVARGLYTWALDAKGGYTELSLPTESRSLPEDCQPRPGFSLGTKLGPSGTHAPTPPAGLQWGGPPRRCLPVLAPGFGGGRATQGRASAPRPGRGQ